MDKYSNGYVAVWIVVAILILKGPADVSSSPVSDEELQTIANTLHIRVNVPDNLLDDVSSHVVRITLSNNGSAPIPSSGWTLYFHSMLLVFPNIFPANKTVDLELEKVRVGMVQGDLYFLQPINGFQSLLPNTTRNYDIIVQWWAVSRTDFMPHWYVTSDNETIVPRVVEATNSLRLEYVDAFDDVRQWKRWTFDRYNPYTAQERMRRLGHIDTGLDAKLIIPTPSVVKISKDGDTFSVDSSWKIFSPNISFSAEAEYLKDLLNLDVAGVAPNQNYIILKSSTEPTESESYQLETNPTLKQVTLTSRDTDGMFYAVQSLRSILDGYNFQNIPNITLQDAPRYHFRGMHLDVARNFHSVDDVKRLMRAMSMYKMNKLHLHLSDDEGWRLEIPDLLELTDIGGNRCHDLKEERCIIPQFGSGPSPDTAVSGYFTVQQYKDILSFAKREHITVIPEFDMPGHAHAAIKSMEARYNRLKDVNITEATKYRLIDPEDTSFYLSVQQWTDNAINPCINSTYTFIGKVMDEVIAMHQDIQPLSIYHFGGDEVANGAWENTTQCRLLPQSMESKGIKVLFATKVAKLASERNLRLGGWEDGYSDGDNNPVPLSDMFGVELFVNPWNNIWEWGSGGQAYKYANAGYKVILSQGTNLYFDHPQEPDPEERGLYWATRMTDTQKVFGFTPDSLYDNIKEERSGKPITKFDICGADLSECEELNQPQNIIGLQGGLWSETVRTSSDMDYMLYPRLLALAERAWHKATFEDTTLGQAARDDRFRDEWEAFTKALGNKEFTRLEDLNITYRLPPPGARVLESGEVEVSTTYPGLGVEYSTDTGHSWTAWSNEVIWQDDTSLLLRSTNAQKTRTSRAVELFKEEPVRWTDQYMVEYIAEHVTLKLDVLDNLQKTDNYITIGVTFTNSGPIDIPIGTWSIYFYSLYGAKYEDLPCGLTVGHVNGGLHYFTPTSRASFTGIKAGAALTCDYHNQYWSISRTDQMPNWYVGSLGMKPKVMQSTVSESLQYVSNFDSPEKWKRTTEDRFDPYTPSVRYNINKKSSSHPRPFKVIPTPEDVVMSDELASAFSPGEWTIVESNMFPFEAQYLADMLNIRKSQTTPTDRYIHFGSAPTMEVEAYYLDIDTAADIVTINASSKQGVMHAVQTFISLVEGNNWKIKKMTIRDSPRFRYRGIMLDVSRNFKPKEWVLKFLDVMSIYKLNKLHLHLSDDEGWRVEIPGIPELTDIGGRRCHSDYRDVCMFPQLGSGPDTDTYGSSFYTAADYREILKYANDRHIEIVPELDMPGHSAAAITAMEVREANIDSQRSHGYDEVSSSFSLVDTNTTYDVLSVQKWRKNSINPCLNSTYRFVEEVVDGLIQLHRGIQPLKVFHVGGDEVPEGVWNNSQACVDLAGNQNTNTRDLHAYFVRRVSEILANKALNLAAWGDGVYRDDKPYSIMDFQNDEVFVYPWSNAWTTAKAKRASQFADNGYQVILALATHLYFDHPQEPDPESRGLYWATRFTDTKKVFGFMPDDIYANADVDRMGNPVNLTVVCENKPCSQPNKTENIIGIQGELWSETIRTEEQFHEMGFPRILALAERAWHEASWEPISDTNAKQSRLQADWEAFADTVGYNEMPRLEKRGIYYLVAPPGAIVQDKELKVNTMFPNHVVEVSSNNGATWREFQKQVLDSGEHKFMFRAKSPFMERTSRVVEMKVTIPQATTSSAAKYSPFKYMHFIVFFSCVYVVLFK